MFTRLTPILPVEDVPAELAFYLRLGLEQHVDPDETYPVEEFAALVHGEHILFGVARAADGVPVPPAGLDWQLETSDVDAVARRAEESGLEVVSAVGVRPWGRRMMTLRSPSGYSVHVEEA